MVRLVKEGLLTPQGKKYLNRLETLAGNPRDIVARRHLLEVQKIRACYDRGLDLPESMHSYKGSNGLAIKMGEVSFYLSSFNRHSF